MRRKMVLLFVTLLVVAALGLGLAALRQQQRRNNCVNVYSVGDLIHPGVLEAFSEETGIRVNYFRLDTGEAGTLPLDRCDLLLGELPLLELMEQYHQLASPDEALYVPPRGIVQPYRSAVLRGTSDKAVPALWTTMGLLHDSAASGAQVTSWNDLFDLDYPGRVVLSGSIQKSLSCALMAIHGDIVSPSPRQQLQAALALMRLERQAVTSHSIGSLEDAFRSRTATLGPCYAGAAIALMNDMPALSFVRPTEGSWQTLLAYAIPAGASHFEQANRLLNHLCRVDSMAKNAAYSGWSTPSLPAFRTLSKSWQRNPLAYGRSGLARLNVPPLLEYHRTLGAYLFPQKPG